MPVCCLLIADMYVKICFKDFLDSVFFFFSYVFRFVDTILIFGQPLTSLWTYFRFGFSTGSIRKHTKLIRCDSPIISDMCSNKYKSILRSILTRQANLSQKCKLTCCKCVSRFYFYYIYPIKPSNIAGLI